jgi:putative DNA primase/helicase
VAKLARNHYPLAKIVIAADNDISGAGQVAAMQAAKAVNGVVAMPQFTDKERKQNPKVSDWLDRWQLDQGASYEQ